MQQLKLALFALILAISLNITTAQATMNSIGKQYMQNISFATLSGDTLSLNDIKNDKPVYLKFWASWCQPCREHMPHLQKTYEKYGKDISVIAINIGINDNPDSITATINEFNLTMPIAIDKSGKLFQAFNAIGTPYHVLLDKEGNIVFKGNQASTQLNDAIEHLTKNDTADLPSITLDKHLNSTSALDVQTNKPTALFFTSAWCDWYLEESRPQMSKNCIRAQNKMNSLSKQFSGINWIGILSRLWTGDKELSEYKKNTISIIHYR